MAISKTALIDIINKHNDPNDSTRIFNIQSTSASNLFAGRFFGNIIIDGDDIVVMESDDTGEELYTLRTGMDNIDIVKYKTNAEMTNLVITIKRNLEKLEERPFILLDPKVSALVTKLKSTTVMGDRVTSEATFESFKVAVKEVEATRTELLRKARPAEDLANTYYKEFGSKATYLFKDLNEVLDDLAGQAVLNSVIDSKLTQVDLNLKTRKNVLDAYVVAKYSATDNYSINQGHVATIDKIVKAITAKEPLDGLVEVPYSGG